jgi:hypothetical protein
MPSHTFQQLIIRILRRPDGHFETRTANMGSDPLGIDETVYSAVQTATRVAQQKSRKGNQSIILLQESSRRWKQIDIIDPRRPY